MEKITADMNIMDAVGCIISTAETLGEGIAAHGLNPDIIIEEANMILEKQGAFE